MEEKFMQDLHEMNQKVMDATEQACKAVLKSGHAKAGHNGPYGNPETPVRNTACWLMGFSEAYRASGRGCFLAAARSCADYLMEKANRPGGGAFVGSRPGWERWDGLMGQAWVMEALCEFYRLTGEAPYLETAREVFLLHGFDDEAGLWKKLGIKGEILGTDQIAHHQLWFAAAGGLLANATGDVRIRLRVERFLDKLEGNLLVYRDGLIMQRIVPRKLGGGSLPFLDKGLGHFKRGVVNPLTGKGLRYKEVAYQATNLYALAMLKDAGYGQAFFQTRCFRRSLSCGFSERMLTSFDHADPKKDSTGSPLKMDMPVNRYAYPYNAPGFSLPYVYAAFRDWLPAEAKDQMKRAVSRQIAVTYCEETGRFAKHTEDGETLNARVYQFLRSVSLIGAEIPRGQ